MSWCAIIADKHRLNMQANGLGRAAFICASRPVTGHAWALAPGGGRRSHAGRDI